MENDDRITTADIVIIPPNDLDGLSEADNGDEEETSADTLSGRQLLSEAEIRTPFHNPADSRSSPAVPQLSFDWQSGQLTNSISPFQCKPVSPTVNNGNLSPATIFELFFDDHIINMIVSFTTTYAQRDKGFTSFETNSAEIRKFFTILLISGYDSNPRRRLFWSNAKDVNNPAIAKLMTCNRFEQLLSVFHLADNNALDSNDKMAKVRPFISSINNSNGLQNVGNG